jgi:hypothetical protein
MASYIAFAGPPYVIECSATNSEFLIFSYVLGIIRKHSSQQLMDRRKITNELSPLYSIFFFTCLKHCTSA